MIQHCNVLSVSNLNRDTCKVLLKPYEKISFKSGQYIKVVMGDSDKRPFSIASCPDDEYIELHIGSSDKNSFSSEIISRLNAAALQGVPVSIEAPYGNAWYRGNSDNPLLLIAGGTGYAYINSILKSTMLFTGERDVFLYWGVRKMEDLYFHKQLCALNDRYPTFFYCPVVEYAPETWSGRVGRLMDNVYKDFNELSSMDIYICGRFEMIQAAQRIMIERKGADKSRIFSDALAI